MKKFLLLLLVLVLGILGAYYYITLSMVNVADAFFTTIKKEHNITKAEKYLANDFKKNTSREQLAQYLVNYKLIDYNKITWGYKRLLDFNANNFGKTGSIEGTVVTKDKVASPLKLQFKQENGAWKIFALEKVLSKKEIEQQQIVNAYTTLARVTLHTLGTAVKENNMTILYNSLSQRWQKETNTTKLRKAYGIFVEKKIDFLPLDKVVPKLTTLNVAKNGILTLAGYYPLGKQNLYFKQQYITENKVWKLAGLALQFK